MEDRRIKNLIMDQTPGLTDPTCNWESERCYSMHDPAVEPMCRFKQSLFWSQDPQRILGRVQDNCSLDGSIWSSETNRWGIEMTVFVVVAICPWEMGHFEPLSILWVILIHIYNQDAEPWQKETIEIPWIERQQWACSGRSREDHTFEAFLIRHVYSGMAARKCGLNYNSKASSPESFGSLIFFYLLQSELF